MEALRAGLAANLSAIQSAQWSAYRLANAGPPCGYVWIGPITYHQTMGTTSRADNLDLMVTVLASLATDIGGQKRLERFLDASGPDSVLTAVEADRTLGGNCDSLYVVDCTGEQIYAPEGKGPYIGADFTVRILT
jgi:hypothetical protein